MRLNNIWCFVLFGVLLCSRITVAQEGDEDPEVAGKKASEWIEILKTSKVVKKRRVALIALRIAGPKARGVFKGVCEALENDKEKIVRVAAAQWLGNQGALARKNDVSLTGSVEALARTVGRDTEAQVRVECASALGRYVDLTRDFKGEVKDALLLVDLKDIVPNLAKALVSEANDKAPEVQAAIADALSRLGPDSAKALDALKEALKKTKAPSTDEASARARTLVIHAIGRVGAPQSLTAINDLLGVLKEDDVPTSVRRQVAVTLGLMKEGAGSAAEALGKLLTDEQLEVRLAAATALQKIGPSASSQASVMLDRIENVREDKFVRCNLIDALGELGGNLRDQKLRISAIVILRKCSKDTNSDVRLAAIQGIGSLGAGIQENPAPDAEEKPSKFISQVGQLVDVLLEIENAKQTLRDSRNDLKTEIRDLAKASLAKLEGTAGDGDDE